ncbi:ABC transporter ATP-binding protein [Undibacterium sp. LFS511W]|uniref:ABC transporter ATP-binding protein n=2 Tax=Undibacterium luofuense TaxID=2828733 RepID=A0A941I8J6_9BURK|nr:ABC transporter ATP-binding protein [Undibacterium luofuense]
MPSDSQPVIRLCQISKTYHMGNEVIHALDQVDLSIQKNEYLAFVGASGSGKSTMMNILGCLDIPSSGQYFLQGRDVAHLPDTVMSATRNREIGFIFQNFHLLPRATALQNVMQPLIFRGIPPAERKQRAAFALERVGLGNRLGHLPNQLSGGQRQRVAIARALCGEPAILLADEPTGNLDTGTGTEVMGLFDALHAEGQTIIIVTHDNQIAAHCQRQIRLSDGKIISDSSRTTQTVPA